MIIDCKSYTFKNPETKYKINKNLKLQLIIEDIYIGSTQAFNIRTSLHKSNIQIEENRNIKCFGTPIPM